MNERLIVRSFGPVKDIDVTFRAITVIIGDQGTGKSCVAKLFSTFKWLEKQLAFGRQKEDYYCKFDRFQKKLCEYHRIDTFLKTDTFIAYYGQFYAFEYKDGKFNVKKKKETTGSLPKICYIPAERSILSVAENRVKLLKELPDSATDFHDMFCEAKKHFRDGYDLPFGNLHYTYDQLNDSSSISINGEDQSQVKLTHASSGVQSALPMCIVTENLAKLVKEKTEIKHSKEEKARLEKQIQELLADPNATDVMRDILIKQLSAMSRYGSFINIAEEPELNLFPKSQLDVMLTLVRNCLSGAENMLIVTTHSPYILAIFNLLILTAKVAEKSGEKTSLGNIVPLDCSIPAEKIGAFCMYSLNGTESIRSLISTETGMIAKNELDSVSGDISQKFNELYRRYATKK